MPFTDIDWNSTIINTWNVWFTWFYIILGQDREHELNVNGCNDSNGILWTLTLYSKPHIDDYDFYNNSALVK